MLSLPGDRQTARVALSLLNAVGLPELAIHTLRAFEDSATELTAAPPALAPAPVPVQSVGMLVPVSGR